VSAFLIAQNLSRVAHTRLPVLADSAANRQELAWFFEIEPDPASCAADLRRKTGDCPCTGIQENDEENEKRYPCIAAEMDLAADAAARIPRRDSSRGAGARRPGDGGRVARAIDAVGLRKWIFDRGGRDRVRLLHRIRRAHHRRACRVCRYRYAAPPGPGRR